MGLAVILSSAALLSGLHGERGLITLATKPGSREYVLSAGRKVLEAAGPMGHSLADQLAALAESTTVSAASSASLEDQVLISHHVADHSEGSRNLTADEDVLGGMEDETVVAESAAVTAAAEFRALDLSPLFLFIGQFYGWWACMVWSVIAVSALAVYRLGLDSD
jgi:hypothetical protein